LHADYPPVSEATHGISARELNNAAPVNLDIDERERALAKLESLLATSPIGIAFFDRDLRYLRINDAHAVINGLPADAHIGRSIHEVTPDLSLVLEPLLQRVLESGEPIRDLQVDKEQRSFLANYFPVRSLQGWIIGVGSMMFEITERRQIEDELRRAVRMREDVLAVVSHDLRSPLSTIDLTTTMLDMQLGSNPRVRNHLAVIHRSAQRMRHMIDDLIDSASIREGRLSLSIAPESADAIMTEALDLQEALAAERAIHIDREFGTDGILVHCDRMRILQVFGNLIGNSIKFCRAGGRIRVASLRTATDIEFSVSDDGPGISADVLPTLFDPYRLPPSQAQAGSGLGLYICKGIIERHGGRIWAGTGGTGTTMYFTLPVSS
jgi:PAS domain S-box-containing protein